MVGKGGDNVAFHYSVHCGIHHKSVFPKQVLISATKSKNYSQKFQKVVDKIPTILYNSIIK